MKLNKFMCGIDGRVVKEQSKRKTRDAYRFRDGGLSGLSVDAEVFAMGVAAAVSTLVKVFQGLLSMSQVG